MIKEIFTIEDSTDPTVGLYRRLEWTTVYYKRLYSPLSESVLGGWKKELNVMEEKSLDNGYEQECFKMSIIERLQVFNEFVILPSHSSVSYSEGGPHKDNPAGNIYGCFPIGDSRDFVHKDGLLPNSWAKPVHGECVR